VGQLPNIINSILPSIIVTICCRLVAESRGEVSMAFVTDVEREIEIKEEIMTGM
jgi:hypothetical protein